MVGGWWLVVGEYVETQCFASALSTGSAIVSGIVPVRRNPQIPCGTIRRSPDRRSNWREAPASVTLLTVGHCFIV